MFDIREIKEFFNDTFKYVVVIAAVFIIALYVVGFSQVVGPSMSPTHEDGEVMILSKLHYEFNDVERLEIIAIQTDTRMLIKRVIGLPGDTIEYKNNTLYLNDKAMEETYLPDDIITDDFKLSEIPGEYEVIPEDMYLVLGDNRQNSDDSRNLGLIKREDILGKCLFTVWPLSSAGVV